MSRSPRRRVARRPNTSDGCDGRSARGPHGGDDPRRAGQARSAAGRCRGRGGARAAHRDRPMSTIRHPLDAALRRLADVDWLIVTSRHGARRVGAAAAAHPNVRLAVVGTATAAELARRAGRDVDLVPSTQTAAALLDAMPPGGDGAGGRGGAGRPRRPRPGRRATEAGLRRCTRSPPTARSCARPDEVELAQALAADALTLASGSAASGWAAAAVRRSPRCVVAIGPTTAAVARESGLQVTHVAADHSVEGLFHEVVAALSPNTRVHVADAHPGHARGIHRHDDHVPPNRSVRCRSAAAPTRPSMVDDARRAGDGGARQHDASATPAAAQDDTDVPLAPAGITDATEPTVSADGRWVVFGGTLEGRHTVFRTDRFTNVTTELSPIPPGAPRGGDTVHPRLSADGCVVAAITEIPFDLFRDDDRDLRWDAYRLVLPECDGQPNGWELVSADPRTGLARDDAFADSAPTLAGSGAVVAFAHQLVECAQGRRDDLRRRPDRADLRPGTRGRSRRHAGRGTERCLPRTAAPRDPAISENGRHLAFVSDTTASQALPGWGVGPVLGEAATAQVFVWDRGDRRSAPRRAAGVGPQRDAERSGRGRARDLRRRPHRRVHVARSHARARPTSSAGPTARSRCTGSIATPTATASSTSAHVGPTWRSCLL